MKELYSAMSEIDLRALGDPRVTNWSEWVGDVQAIECYYCKSKVSTSDYFCHYCGSGIKPKPCFHVQKQNINDPLPIKNDVEIEPEMIIFNSEGFTWIKIRCPECAKETSRHPRSYFACNEWNTLSLSAMFPEENSGRVIPLG